MTVGAPLPHPAASPPAAGGEIVVYGAPGDEAHVDALLPRLTSGRLRLGDVEKAAA